MEMHFRHGSRAALAGALMAASLLVAGCAQIREHRGYRIDEVLVGSIQPGVDNRESVAATLGRPTFAGQFDDRDWYYVSRNTRQLAFALPRPTEQAVLRIRFDEAGNVERVDRTGLELAANIDPADEKTPTLGRDRSFFEELFGNIGAVGGLPRNPGSSDNPQ